MKHVKRLALLLLLVFALAFAACGDGDSSGGKSSDKKSSSEKSSDKETKKRSTYKTPIEDMVKLINKQSTDIMAYLELLMDPLAFKYTKEVVDVLKKTDDFADEYEDAQDDIKDFYADIKGFEITKVDFISADEMSNKELREYNSVYDNDYIDDILDELKNLDQGDIEDAADALDIKVSDMKKIVKAATSYFESMKKAEVTEGYEVTIRIYGKYDGDSDKTEKIEDLHLLKMDGKWYLADGYRLFRGMCFHDDLDDIDMYELYRYIDNVQNVNFGSFL